MRQVWILRPGKPEVLTLREAPDPIPGAGEVRIRVAAIGVNFADILGRMGIYSDGPGIPYVPGYDVAGTIDAVGQGVTDLREGDDVMALTRFNGYADVAVVPAVQTFRRLQWMSAEHGAALPLNYLTAYYALIVFGALKPSDRVLIHAAAGGVGLAAIDLCKITGAYIYATASAAKHDFLRERGVHEAIDYNRIDYARVIDKETDGRGVTLILDALGGRHWRKNYRLLAPTGRLICYGLSSAAPGKRRSLPAFLGLLATPYYSPRQLMRDNKAVAGLNIAHMWDQAPLMRRWMKQIVAWYDDALFRPHIDRTFRLEDAAQAHDYVQERKNVGKVLLIP